MYKGNLVSSKFLVTEWLLVTFLFTLKFHHVYVVLIFANLNIYDMNLRTRF